MPLQWQNVPIDFRGGVDTKSDRKTVVQNKLLVLENGEMNQLGAINKRNGYRKLEGAVFAKNRTVAAFAELDVEMLRSIKASDNELVGYTNGCSYLRGIDSFSETGHVSSVTTDGETLAKEGTGAQHSNGDVAVSSDGILAYAWNGSSRARIVDPSTGSIIVEPTLLNWSGDVIKIITLGADFVFIYDGGSNNLTALKIEAPLYKTPGTPTTLVSNFSSTNDLFDVVKINDNRFVVAYENTTNDLEWIAYLADLSSDGGGTDATTNPADQIGVAYVASQDQVHICVDNGTNNVVVGYNVVTDSTDFGPVSIAGVRGPCVGADIGTESRFFISTSDSSSPTAGNITTRHIDSSGTVSQTESVNALDLASKPFKFDDRIYFNAVYNSPLQSTYFLMDSGGVSETPDIKCVGKYLPGQAYDASSQLGHGFSHVVCVADEKYVWARVFVDGFVQDLGTESRSLASLTANFTKPINNSGTKIADTMHTAGGALKIFDGTSTILHGFQIFPEDYSLSQTTGGSIADGTYSVRVTVEGSDAEGRLHRSAPGPIETITISGGGGTAAIRVTWGAFPFGSFGQVTNEQAVYYRTAASGSVFFRTADGNPGSQRDLTESDANLTDNTILYTTGGELDNIAAPSSESLVANNDRLFLYNKETDSIYFSKRLIDGEGMAFSDALRIRLNPRGGKGAVLGELDGNVIAFKSNNIQVISGDGPADTGSGGQFDGPSFVATDTGAREGSPVVQTDLGLVFVGERGPYLLNRSLQVQYIGADVEGFNDLNFTDAVEIEDKHQVRFSTEDGQTLVWDYVQNQWSTFTGLESSSAERWLGNHTIARANGDIWTERSDEYSDDGKPYPLKIGTSWVKLTGIQGYQRIRRAAVIGERFSDHTFVVRMYYDYNDDFYHEVKFDTATAMPVGDDLFQFRWRIPRQKTEAIRFEFFDEDQTGNMRSYSLNNLTLEVGGKGGIFRLPARKTG